MKSKRPRYGSDRELPKFKPVPRHHYDPPPRRWSAVHLIPIGLLATVATAITVQSCDDSDWRTTTTGPSGSHGGGGGWFYRSFGGGGGSHSAHSTNRGGFGRSGHFFS